MNARKPEDRQPDGVVLITGGDTGIGLALAKEFAHDNRELVLVARNRTELRNAAAELEKISGKPVRTYVADLAKPDAAKRLVAALAKDKVHVHTLVNNAGIGLLGPVAESDSDRHAAMLRLNVDTLADLTARLLPAMVKRGSGGILNLGSTAAFIPGPGMAGYYASKAFVRSFSEGLAGELVGTGVTVTCLCPGPTRTKFAVRAGVHQSSLFRRPTTAEAVARIGYRAFRRGKRVVVADWNHRLTINLLRLLPRRISGWAAGRVHRTKD